MTYREDLLLTSAAEGLARKVAIARRKAGRRLEIVLGLEALESSGRSLLGGRLEVVDLGRGAGARTEVAGLGL